MKTALVCDWIVALGGAEKVLESIWEIYPAKIHALVADKKNLRKTFFGDKEIQTSFLQKFPKAEKYYRNFLPLFPMAIEQFNLSDYDLIISSSHAVAKGVLTHAQQLHICYCCTPMRYAWDLYHQYLNDLSGIRKKSAKWALHYLRNWDIASLNRVDHFIAISNYIAKRIQKTYQKESAVIYPPVNTHLFNAQEKREDYYLAISRMVPYKKLDLIVEAFSNMPQKRLVVIGEGPQMTAVKAKAKSNIEILGYQNDEVVRKYLSCAKAFVFGAEEDFGIVPVEAQAAGTPVIAFGKGGVLETVVENETGIFFHEQTFSSIIDAVDAFEKKRDNFDPIKIKAHAENFGVERFKREFKNFVEKKWEEFHENHHLSRR